MIKKLLMKLKNSLIIKCMMLPLDLTLILSRESKNYWKTLARIWFVTYCNSLPSYPP